MWASMTRKPGDPADVMATTIEQVSTRMTAERITGGRTELRFDKIWLGVLNRLCQKDYVYDAGQLGDMAQLAEKVTYFYLRAAYGVSAFPQTLKTLKAIRGAGLAQGIHANGQIASPIQLSIELGGQGPLAGLGEVFDPSLCLWSYETGVRKESERGMALLEQALAAKGIRPQETLIVGSDVARDVAPARKRGFMTALLLADRQTAAASPADLKDEKTRPHALLLAIEQALETLPN
jgi:FMN phosphatase YigB (HAD superfamily)